MIELSGFAPRDAKIIKENEGKSVYELLQLGLSAKAGDRLSAMNYDSESKTSDKEPEQKEEPRAKQPEPLVTTVESNVVKPASVKQVSKVQVTSPKEYKKQRISSQAGSVLVLNKRTGGKVRMSSNSAQRLLKQPHLYTIVQQ